MFLVVLMAGLMMVVGLAVAGEIGLIVMAVIALGINLYSYYNSHSMVPKMMGGQLVTAAEAPDLFRIVERAACQAKMPFKKNCSRSSPSNTSKRAAPDTAAPATARATSPRST